MKKITLLIFLGVVVIFGFGNEVFAYQIQYLEGTKVDGDIVLGPTKIELFLDPGETTTQEIMVTNRTGRTVNFGVEIEDFMGSHSPDQSIILLGEAKGPYSLKDWVRPEIKEFALNHGQRIHLPVKITIPPDVEPGGHYGVVFASALPPAQKTEGETGNAQSQMSIISRVGSLFFVRVKGDVAEEGYLKDFKTPEKYYEKGPIVFQLLFENKGSVHLTPYGTVEIFNLLGKKVEEIEVDSYFAMPDSLKLREIEWKKELLFGKYTALASINRGYEDIIDQKSIEFWVIPWKIILAGFIGLLLMILFFRWILSRFEIRRK